MKKPTKTQRLSEKAFWAEKHAAWKNFPYEPFKQGRYAKFYRGIKHPLFFSCLDGEKATGSTPGGFLASWTKKRPQQKPLDRMVPQIKLIPPNELMELLQERIDIINSEEKRRQMDTIPGLGKILREQTRETLAAIDWAEQTHGTKIEVDHKILEWLSTTPK